MSAVRLPERLPLSDVYAILAGDCIALAAVGVAAVIRRQAPGAVVLQGATFIAVGAAAGAFSQSFALRARDEAYYSTAVGLLAAPIALGAAAYLHLSLPLAALAVASVAAVDGVCRTIRTAARRRGTATADCLKVDDAGRSRVRSTAHRAIMRGLDLGLALAGGIIAAPASLAIGTLVYASSGNPVIFAQERVGRDGHTFTMFKFRTMRNGSGGAWVQPGDGRLTRIGAFLRRTSLDELPQLLNVVRGEMSLVGPRPEMCEYAARFERDLPHYSQRHLVRPGITGWAQLHLPRNLQPADMSLVAAYDNFYVQHNGVVLYIFAIVKTAAEVLAHRAV